ncbi:MAG: hypothetical protein CMN32_13835 [Saprospirales bacterium]|nr:hypothetical protein [Saprospirales bacterium]
MQLHKHPTREEWPGLIARPVIDWQSVELAVQAIFEEVKTSGDAALRELTRRFDGAELEAIAAGEAEMAAAAALLDESLKKAIQTAAANIRKFHQAQWEACNPVETMPGVLCWRRSVPIEKVGLYIPGGSAPLFSTVLMLALPAAIAGCREVVLCTPPRKDGSVHPAILFAAQLAGVKRVYRVGGAQAIAAMAFGTEGIPKVDKIFGPGNRYVTAAKALVQRHGTATDLPAGPSEVLVIADDTARPDFVAADLLAQAEHDADAQVILVATSERVLCESLAALEQQLATLPRRDIAAAALAHSRALLLRSEEEAIEFSNAYAPEHLILATANAKALAAQVRNAGSVFIGHWCPESAGDYASGTNHTLPTGGAARAYSGVSLDSFLKKITFQQISPRGLRRLGPTVSTMARAEELEAHARAVDIRLEADASADDEAAPSSKNDLHRLVRPALLSLKPYSSARSEFSCEARAWLDANENAEDLSGLGLNRYPDPLQLRLKRRLSELKSIGEANIFLGNGSDEAIDLLLRIFCEPGLDNVLTCPPTYGMYGVLAGIHGVEQRQVPLDRHFRLRPEAVLAAADQRSKLLFLCSPNNPTGNLLRPADVEFLLREFPGIVVLDEAYIDFAAQPSWLSRLPEFPNLVILQTLSKAWALAGARLGMAFAAESIIDIFNKVKYPYNISELTQRAALAALENTGAFDQYLDRLYHDRLLLAERLQALPIVQRVFPSEANFLLVRFRQADEVFRSLRNEGIIVRNRSSEIHCHGCLRITVGTSQENELLLKTLERLSRIAPTP